LVTQELQSSIYGKSVLLLDDVADSGESLLVLRRYLLSKRPRKVTIATLYIKPWTRITPDYYVARTKAWIIFPWELVEAIKSVMSKGGIRAVTSTRIPSKYVKRLRPLFREETS
jgi:uncharacterized protein